MEDKVHALLEQTVSDDETKATTAEASHQAYTWVVDIYNLWMYVDHTRKFPYIEKPQLYHLCIIIDPSK